MSSSYFETSSRGGSLVGRAIGTVVNPVLEFIDVNGVLQRIDLEEALDRVDLNKLLDRIDVNRHLSRVDVDSFLDKVDIDRLVQRSNLGAIVARSSSGFFNVILDGARSRMVIADQSFQRIGRCGCCGKGKRGQQRHRLSPRVGTSSHRRDQSRITRFRHTRKTKNKETTFQQEESPITIGVRIALDAQGRYAGILSRFIANCIDNSLLFFFFAILVLLIDKLYERITGNKEFEAVEWVLVPVLYYIFGVLYSWISLAAAGRTIGLAICGLKAVNNRDGCHIGGWQALWRALVEPLSLVTVVGIWMGWVRRDGRQLHDILSGTGVTYCWDARLEYLRQQATPMEAKEPLHDV